MEIFFYDYCLRIPVNFKDLRMNSMILECVKLMVIFKCQFASQQITTKVWSGADTIMNKKF